jgi:uncharacterized protein
MKRIVCDTNIYISALIFPNSKPDQVLELVRQDLIKLYTSHFIIDEFYRIVTKKFRLPPDECEIQVKQIQKIASLLEPKMKISIIREKDDDNRIIECAVAAKADYLISGDKKHILPLQEYAGITICNPAEFLRSRLWIETK